MRYWQVSRISLKKWTENTPEQARPTVSHPCCPESLAFLPSILHQLLNFFQSLWEEGFAWSVLYSFSVVVELMIRYTENLNNKVFLWTNISWSPPLSLHPWHSQAEGTARQWSPPLLAQAQSQTWISKSDKLDCNSKMDWNITFGSQLQGNPLSISKCFWENHRQTFLQTQRVYRTPFWIRQRLYL